MEQKLEVKKIMNILYNNAKEVLYNRIRQKLDLMNKTPGVVIKSNPGREFGVG